MAGNVVQMDYQVVGNVSKGFDNASKTLTTVGKVLKVLINILKATAFLSLGTTKALQIYLEGILSKVTKLSKVCDEFSNDLARAIDDHKKGDMQGKRYFGEGVSR